MPKARRICEPTSTVVVRQPRVAHSGMIFYRDWETGVSSGNDWNIQRHKFLFVKSRHKFEFIAFCATANRFKPSKRDKSSQRQIIAEEIYLSVYVNELIWFLLSICFDFWLFLLRIAMKCDTVDSAVGKFDFLIKTNFRNSIFVPNSASVYKLSNSQQSIGERRQCQRRLQLASDHLSVDATNVDLQLDVETVLEVHEEKWILSLAFSCYFRHLDWI